MAVEALLVAGAGLLVALMANGISSRGLELGRDYFPGAARPLAHGVGGSNVTLGAGTILPLLPSTDALAERIRARGLQVVSSNAVHALFQDPRTAQEQIIFLDARNEQEYRAGHIPGAYLFDHYRATDYLATVLPACLTAEQVVVYCTGGECEDSEFAAVMLRDAGVPAERLLVYAGGLTEWAALGWPVETGERHSGAVQSRTP